MNNYLLLGLLFSLSDEISKEMECEENEQTS